MADPWPTRDQSLSQGDCAEVSDVALIGWANSDSCSCINAALAANPSSGDLQPTAFVRAVTKETSDYGALYYSPDPNPAAKNPEDCVDDVCTGLANDVLVDVDGTLFGAGPETSAVARNGGALEGDTRAAFQATYNAYIVPNSRYRYGTVAAHATCCPESTCADSEHMHQSGRKIMLLAEAVLPCVMAVNLPYYRYFQSVTVLTSCYFYAHPRNGVQ